MSEALDRLRAAAEAEFAAQREPANKPTVVEQPTTEVPPTTQVEQPAPDPAPPVTETTETPTRRVVYKKVVDLGDGTAPQVFKAATKDELIDKIFEAQVNASKRIKQLKDENRKLLQNVQPDPALPLSYQPKTLTAEQELELVNELQVNPSGGLAKALEAMLGAPLEEVRSTLRDVKQRDAVHAVGNQFIAAHPEYPINTINEKRMAEYLNKNKLAWTLKNLELAFADLQEAGLVTGLTVDPTSNNDDDIEEEVVSHTPAARPVAPAAPIIPVAPAVELTEAPRRRKAVVGISSSQTVATVEQDSPHEASVEDFLKRTPEERRRIVLAQVGRQA